MTDHTHPTALVPRAGVGRIERALTRRRSVLTALASTAALTACGGSDGASGSGATPDGTIEDSLNVYNWADYDDPDNLAAFEASGPRLQVDSYASNEEMIAKLVAANGASGYDIVVPTGLFVPQMAQNGLIQAIDHSRLTNYGNLDPAYLGRSWDPGNEHSIPKSWGTTGFVYDNTVITRPLTSWADFLDAAQREASGNTSILEDPWEVMCIWFAANGVDPNTTDETQIAAARDGLVAGLAPHLKGFESNPGSSAIAQSTFALMQCWNGDARLGIDASDDPDKWTFVFPTPTANLWIDNWCITAGAEHPDAAYAFIDFMLQEENSVREVLYLGYPTAVRGIGAAAEAAGLDRAELVFPDESIVDRLTVSVLNEGHQATVEAVAAIRAAAGNG
ncbi:spermidine/putrescine ABC transporter substrate-binding protein [Kineococcus sp. LSe6-4]|uniref:Spermidine/putrescine ABC transporter substrate-binding protein n=1 Tax=Kineococcus halophytocola TaxID=3234027 RepID=A0ABV4GZF0_9ACTN